MNNTKYKELAVNTFVFALSNLATKLIAFFCLPILTTYLLTSEYGVLDLSQTFINLCVPIFTIAISDAVLRFGLIDNSKKKDVFAIGLKITLISIVIMLPCSVAIACFLNKAKIWYFIYIIYVITSINTLSVSELKVINKTFIISIGSLLSSVITILSVIITVKYLRFGLYGYYFSIIFGNFVALLIYSISLFRNRCIVLIFDNKNAQKQMISYSFPLVPNSVFWWANNGLDKVCLKLLESIETSGVYSAVGKIPSILNLFISIFQQAWNISAIKTYKDKDDRFIRNMSDLYTYSMIFVASWIVSLIPIITKFFYSGDYIQGVYLIPMLTLSVYYTAKSSFIGSLYNAKGLSKLLFSTTMIGTFFNLIGNLTLIPIIGALGAAIATCISNIVVFVIRHIKSKKDLDLSFEITNLAEVCLIVQCVLYSIKVTTYVWFNLIITAIITVIVLNELKPYLTYWVKQRRKK